LPALRTPTAGSDVAPAANWPQPAGAAVLMSCAAHLRDRTANVRERTRIALFSLLARRESVQQRI